MSCVFCCFFHFNIGFSTTDTRNVKKGKHVSIQTNEIFILCKTSWPGSLRPIFRTIDFLVQNKLIISIFSV